MTLVIQIDCEDENEIYAHLEVIKETLKRKFETQVDLNESFEAFDFQDNNCYGTHRVTVYDEL